MATVIRPDDPMLVAIKAELLHGIPELTGKQINAAAMLALIAIKRWKPVETALEFKRICGEGVMRVTTIAS
jgi:hypothetical protein